MALRTLLCFLLVLSLSGPLGRPAGGASADEDGWRVFRSDEGRFQVELPDEPQLERSERSTLLGAVREERYTLRFGETLVAVQAYDIPRIAARLVPTSTILERTRAGVLSDMDAELVATSETTLQGYAALDFTYRVSGDAPLFERALAVLVGNRIYLVTGMAPRSPGAQPEIARFFASFRFWPEGAESETTIKASDRTRPDDDS